MLANRVFSESNQPLGELYDSSASQVRRNLAAFGVAANDLDDLLHEVFLVVMAKRAALPQVERVDLWLREICRKVAAGHRRRAGRQREVHANGEFETIEDATPEQSVALEAREETERLKRALDALDDEARDLIAMHELGGLPLVDVATLVERDRKTVSKRLSVANRQLVRLFRDQDEPRRVNATPVPRISVPPAATSGAARNELLRVLARSSDVTIGLLGPVIVAVWPGPPTLDALALLDEQLIGAAARLGSGLAYLAIVEASTSTPSLAARQQITQMLRRHASHYGVYPHVLLGGLSWIARPIMAGLALLAGIPSAMPFFGSLERAATWLATGYLRHGGLDVPTLVSATNELRALAAAHTASAAPR